MALSGGEVTTNTPDGRKTETHEVHTVQILSDELTHATLGGETLTKQSQL